MKLHIDNFKKNVLLKVSSINAVGILVKLITGVLSSKFIASFLGAEGMALIGNLRNAITSIQSLTTLGLYNGIVKYIAENKENKKELYSILSGTYILCLITTFILGIILFFGSSFWNNLVFGDQEDFSYIFKMIGIVLPFYTANVILLAVINGFSKYKIYVLLTSISNIIALCIIVFLIWQYKLEGAFWAIVLTPVLSLVFSIIILYNQKELISFRIQKVFPKHIKQLGTYALMALVSATLFPWVLIHIRNYIIESNGAAAAGYWEAMQNISHKYMLFISTLLTLYILPKFSEIKSSRLFKLEVLNFYKVILPLFAIGFVIIYLLRTIIIKILFSPDFVLMEQLFSWHLSGDLLKIASLVLSYQFLAKKMFWHYIITEIVSLSVLYTLSIYCIESYGWVGVSIAHFFYYLFYLVLLVFIFRKLFFGPERQLV